MLQHNCHVILHYHIVFFSKTNTNSCKINDSKNLWFWNSSSCFSKNPSSITKKTQQPLFIRWQSHLTSLGQFCYSMTNPNKGFPYELDITSSLWSHHKCYKCTFHLNLWTRNTLNKELLHKLGSSEGPRYIWSSWI